jgi:hypothetical protein
MKYPYGIRRQVALMVDHLKPAEKAPQASFRRLYLLRDDKPEKAD